MYLFSFPSDWWTNSGKEMGGGKQDLKIEINTENLYKILLLISSLYIYIEAHGGKIWVNFKNGRVLERKRTFSLLIFILWDYGQHGEAHCYKILHHQSCPCQISHFLLKFTSLSKILYWIESKQ